MRAYEAVKVALAALTMLLASGAYAAVPSVAEIESCMRANVPAAMQVREFSLNSIDKNGGERNLRGRLFAARENGQLRSMMKIEMPLDLRGAAYLLREGKPGEQDAMYVFLPALNKTRRIVGGTQDAPLFGTDISYADVKQIHGAFVGGAIELEKTEVYENRESYVLMLRPDAQQQSQFSGIRSWVDKQSCVPLKAEFINEQQVRKRYTVKPADLKQAGPHWYASKALMEDIGGGTRTQIELSGVKSLESLANNYFNPRSFQLAN